LLEKFFELNPEAEADFISQIPMGRKKSPKVHCGSALMRLYMSPDMS
jgi:hypothetical protein